MTTVQKSIDVNADVRTVYDQWTQFEKFPDFMEGVEKVQQLNDTHLHWQADIAGVTREWDAEIVEQVPDQVIAWRATGEVGNNGRVRFEKLAADKTRVSVALDYDPKGFAEKAADWLKIVDMRVQGDLERFKKFIEQRGTETGAWRGEVHQGVETSPSGTTMSPTGTTTAGTAGDTWGTTGTTGAATTPPNERFGERRP